MADVENNSLLLNYAISWKIITIIEIIKCFLVLYHHRYKTVNKKPDSINTVVYCLKSWQVQRRFSKTPEQWFVICNDSHFDATLFALLTSKQVIVMWNAYISHRCLTSTIPVMYNHVRIMYSTEVVHYNKTCLLICK
jgi:hypothetical protein